MTTSALCSTHLDKDLPRLGRNAARPTDWPGLDHTAYRVASLSLLPTPNDSTPKFGSVFAMGVVTIASIER
jgi:hypothetical protein